MTTASARDDVLTFLTRRLAEMTRQGGAVVTADSVFVELGLQSIDAVLLCGEVEDRFGIELDPALIFEHETVGSFAREVGEIVAPR